MRTSFSNYTVVNNTLSKNNIYLSVENEKKETKKTSIEKSYEQSLIDDFKEHNSPQNNRISEIYNKFKGGKELTSEEMEYLAKNSPEIYKEVKEIMMEREAMELQMELAKTKQEVANICLNEMTSIKKNMGTGKQTEAQAMKIMARTNQMADAHIQYTASIEYREKEDAVTQAEELREKLRESQEQIDEQKERQKDEEIHIAELKSDTEVETEFAREENSDIESISDSKKAVNLLQDIEEEKDEQKKEQQRQNRRHKKNDQQIQSVKNMQLDYETLWMKTKNLYRSHKTTSNDGSEANSFNLRL